MQIFQARKVEHRTLQSGSFEEPPDLKTTVTQRRTSSTTGDFRSPVPQYGDEPKSGGRSP
ncbi:MAG: hypothetical protein HY296_02435 [Thaumarchaeota archaeon]|nr:hypothetical protein [Nitrososphaerota archaeon]